MARTPSPTRPAVRAAAALLPALLAALASPGCAGDAPPKVAAATVESGAFGGLMATSEGEMLMPLVERDAGGALRAVRGVLWRDAAGQSVAIYADPATGRPSRTVLGDFVLVFSNWSADGTTADVARIYVPLGGIEIFRGVRLQDPDAARSGAVSSAATCLPDCPTRIQTLSESLKLGGVLLSAGSCYAAAGLTWGAMLLPCTGFVIGAAKTVVGNEAWLEDLNGVGRYLTGADVIQCALSDPGSCVSLGLEAASATLDKVNAVLTGADPLIRTAEEHLASIEAPIGLVQGTMPPFLETYECTPGAFLPCLEEGTRQCGPDGRWGECPEPVKPQHFTGGQCSDGGSMCDCTYLACVKVTGTSVKCWYRTLLGDFPCSSCQACEGAARAVVAACCPDDE